MHVTKNTRWCKLITSPRETINLKKFLKNMFFAYDVFFTNNKVWKIATIKALM